MTDQKSTFSLVGVAVIGCFLFFAFALPDQQPDSTLSPSIEAEIGQVEEDFYNTLRDWK